MQSGHNDGRSHVRLSHAFRRGPFFREHLTLNPERAGLVGCIMAILKKQVATLHQLVFFEFRYCFTQTILKFYV